MVDKISTVPKTKVRMRIGRLAEEDMVRLNRAIIVFLGIAAHMIYQWALSVGGRHRQRANSHRDALASR
jgi:hypothetical protein